MSPCFLFEFNAIFGPIKKFNKQGSEQDVTPDKRQIEMLI
jgi:hypothetical protein